MKPQPFSIVLAGIPLTIQPLFSETAQQFGCFCQPPCPTASIISIDMQTFFAARTFCSSEMTDAALEYSLFVVRACDALLPFNRCIFHGTAFFWRGKSYIFTAPSGTGKSTQYRLWMKLYSGETYILNGDKPVLECRADGTLWVHPSPWTGKERWGSMTSAPLGGIIYLSQAKENSFARLSARQAVLPVFRQFLFSAASAEAVHQVCAIEDHILRTVPIWHLANCGDEASAQLCHDTLLQFEEGNP